MKNSITAQQAIEAVSAVRDLLYRVDPDPDEQDDGTPTPAKFDIGKELDYRDAIDTLAGIIEALELTPQEDECQWQPVELAEDTAPDRREYKSVYGLATWWPKDGAFHIALPAPDPDPKTGLKTGGFLYTAQPYHTRDEAIAAILSTRNATLPATYQ